jgi:hypothetical protein
MKLTLAIVATSALSACACSCAAEGPALLLVSTQALTPAPFEHSHQLLTQVLASHVSRAGVDYANLAKESDLLNRYLAGVQAVRPEELALWTEPQQFAFWINTYNAHILRLILDHYPIESIRDLGGTIFGLVWDLPLIPMGSHNPDGSGEPLSFGDLEHQILRPRFKDARVHAAINCASVSCPPILAEAFEATKIEQQLDDAMRAFVLDEERNHLIQESNRLELSGIFDWFQTDFDRDAGSVRQFVLQYAGDSGGDWILGANLSYLDYSWALNDHSGLAGE